MSILRTTDYPNSVHRTGELLLNDGSAFFIFENVCHQPVDICGLEFAYLYLSGLNIQRYVMRFSRPVIADGPFVAPFMLDRFLALRK